MALMRGGFAGALLMLVAANATAANPDQDVQTIPVQDVHQLVFSGAGRLHLTHHTGAEYVRLAGPSSALSEVTVARQGRTLIVRGASPPVEVTVNASRLDSVSMDTNARTHAAPSCNLVLSGAARAQLGSVTANVVEINVDGGARLQVQRITAWAITGNLMGDGHFSNPLAGIEVR